MKRELTALLFPLANPPAHARRQALAEGEGCHSGRGRGAEDRGERKHIPSIKTKELTR
jgi:hypothetical protein